MTLRPLSIAIALTTACSAGPQDFGEQPDFDDVVDSAIGKGDGVSVTPLGVGETLTGLTTRGVGAAAEDAFNAFEVAVDEGECAYVFMRGHGDLDGQLRMATPDHRWTAYGQYSMPWAKDNDPATIVCDQSTLVVAFGVESAGTYDMTALPVSQEDAEIWRGSYTGSIFIDMLREDDDALEGFLADQTIVELPKGYVGQGPGYADMAFDQRTTVLAAISAQNRVRDALFAELETELEISRDEIGAALHRLWTLARNR